MPQAQKVAGLTARISGQPEPLQPVSRAQAKQATISPTTHGHASCGARYQTRPLDFQGRGDQEVNLRCLFVKRLNVKVTVTRIVLASENLRSRSAHFPHSVSQDVSELGGEETRE